MDRTQQEKNKYNEIATHVYNRIDDYVGVSLDELFKDEFNSNSYLIYRPECVKWVEEFGVWSALSIIKEQLDEFGQEYKFDYSDP